MITLGLCSGLVLHTAAVAIGLAALIQTSPLLFGILKMIGAVYLATLAWQAFKAPAKVVGGSMEKENSGRALYRRGILMNVSNPKVSLFFLAFLPQFTNTESGNTGVQLMALGALFMLIAAAVFTSIACLAARLGYFLGRYPNTALYLNRLTGMLLGTLAIVMFSSVIWP